MLMKTLENENPDERAYLYSGKLISRLGFFLLRGVDETPFKNPPATNPKDRSKVLQRAYFLKIRMPFWPMAWEGG